MERLGYAGGNISIPNISEHQSSEVPHKDDLMMRARWVYQYSSFKVDGKIPKRCFIWTPIERHLGVLCHHPETTGEYTAVGFGSQICVTALVPSSVTGTRRRRLPSGTVHFLCEVIHGHWGASALRIPRRELMRREVREQVDGAWAVSGWKWVGEAVGHGWMFGLLVYVVSMFRCDWTVNCFPS